jgi:hypothetical protein
VETSKVVTVAVFADMNGDGLKPTYTNDPALWPLASGGSNEFLGQLASSSIEGKAFSSIYPRGDFTDTGIAASSPYSFPANKPRVLFPYGLSPSIGSGTFTLEFSNITSVPKSLCVILYDYHPGSNIDGGHSPLSAQYGSKKYNDDNSLEKDDTQVCASIESLSFSIAGNTTLCANTSPVTYTSTINNPNADPITYLWTLENNTAGAAISGSNTGPSISVVPTGAGFTVGGSYGVKLLATRLGISNISYLNSDVAPGTIVKVGWCNPEIICTYSLDFYGSEPEIACGNNGDQIATVSTMTNAMNNVGGSKVFGIQPNNKTFTLNQADIAAGGNIFTMLPGTNGVSGALVGNTSFNGNAIDNPLLAHSMVLFFNLQTSPTLGPLLITNNMWTQQIDCVSGALIPNTNLLTQMPASIVSYLFNANNGYPRTVAGLFALANDALGGKDLGDENVIVIPSFDDIKTAVQKINAAFNECRRLVPADINATGFIYNDDDGMLDGIIDFSPGSPLNGPALGGVYLTLIEGDAIDINGENTGQILKVSPIDANGNYLFDPVVNGTYTINMGTTSTGDRKPLAPSGKVFTAEGGNVINGYATGDGMPNGRIVMTVKDNDPPIFKALRPTAVLNDLNYGIANAPLPIKLVTFDGKNTSEGNKLVWKTTNETDFSHFELEKSTNAIEFGSIATVKGNNSNIYNQIDANPIEGINYYRLKMVDLDGTSKLSNVISVNFEKGADFVSIQNPTVNGEFDLKTNLIDAKFTLLNSHGSKINLQLTEYGTNAFRLNTQAPAGVYYLTIESKKGKMITKKVVIP